METLHENLTHNESVWWPKHHAHEPTDARLRAKYWDAMANICRPLLKSILGRSYMAADGVAACAAWSAYIATWDPNVQEANIAGLQEYEHCVPTLQDGKVPKSSNDLNLLLVCSLPPSSQRLRMEQLFVRVGSPPGPLSRRYSGRLADACGRSQGSTG